MTAAEHRRGWVPPLPGERGVALDPRLPPFGVHHLLAWTACCGLTMTASQALTTDFGLNPVEVTKVSPLQVSFEILFGVGLGTHLFICLAGMWWKRRGVWFFDQPGHLVAFTGAVCQSLVIAVGRLESIDLLSLDWYPVISFCFIVVLSVLGGVLIRGGRKLPALWAVTLRFAGALSLILAPLIILTSLPEWLIPKLLGLLFFLLLVALFAMLVAIIGSAASIATDLQRRVRWHWSHWMAVWTLSIQLVGIFVLCAVFIAIVE